MKNERINLTPGLCRDLKARDKEYFVYDLNCPGLWLRIYPSGFKTWYYHYRPKGRPTTSIKLKRNGKGRLPEVKIVLAKKKLN